MRLGPAVVVFAEGEPLRKGRPRRGDGHGGKTAMTESSRRWGGCPRRTPIGAIEKRGTARFRKVAIGDAGQG